jgi:hypothetical protein
MSDEATKKPELKLVPEEKGEEVTTPIEEATTPIAKPEAFDLNKFKSKQKPTIADVETLQTALPVHSLADAKDFVRLHENEEKYWSDELCFVNVPIKGQKHHTLHLIDEELAMRFLPSARIIRMRLALATKPYDVFFLCQVPSRNLENPWNKSNLRACEQAKTKWTMATSRKAEGVEDYKIDSARNPKAFPDPKWPTQLLEELIGVTYASLTIVNENDPGLLRLIGEVQKPL